MTHEDFVTYEQAKALKALGFDWEVVKGYSHFPGEKVKTFNAQEENINAIYSKWCFAAPTLAQAQKWLREVKCIIVHAFIDDDSDEPWSYEILSTKRDEDGDWVYLVPHWNAKFYSKDPDPALLAGIDKAIELLKQQRK